MNDPTAARAAIHAARARVRRAAEACRKAGQLLAEADAPSDLVGQVRATTVRDADSARDLVLLALTEHDQVDVVVLAPPRPAR